MRPVEQETPQLPMRRESPFHPPAAYERLREDGGVARFSWPNGVQAWLVTKYAEVREALSHPLLSVDRTASPPPSLALGRTSGVMLPRSLVGMDPPEHTGWRRLIIRELTVRRVARLRPRIEEIVDGYLDQMAQAGPPADLVPSFALPIPSMVISELLGVPPGDRAEFQRHTEVISAVGAPPEQVHKASAALMDYIGELIKAKRLAPGDDMLSHLAQSTLDGAPVPDAGLLGNGMLLLIAGHETTSNMITLGVVTMLSHPDQLALLRADSSLIDRAVEEVLRFHAVIQYGVVRRATADLVIGGQQIRAGEWVVCSLASANRDAGNWQDPDRFLAAREPLAHTSFGYGVHQCAGQHLARLELRIALAELFRRFPRLRLAEPAQGLPFRGDMFVYGLHRLPLEW
ncbi:MAG TPA: cytochrome P450 [Streptosporangiaceae bacterium]|nr:cytochrome P450 [Streptosporangiaceae bacterium]